MIIKKKGDEKPAWLPSHIADVSKLSLLGDVELMRLTHQNGKCSQVSQVTFI